MDRKKAALIGVGCFGIFGLGYNAAYLLNGWASTGTNISILIAILLILTMVLGLRSERQNS